MKSKRKANKCEPLASVKTKSSQENLKHILNALEQAALKNNYKPFLYDYNGIPLYISRHTCNQLITSTTNKFTFFSKLIERERLSMEIPIRLRENFYDPRKIRSLSPILRSRLYRLECYTLFSIMTKGRSFFKEEHKFGKHAMQILDDLFAKYRCKRLFK